MWEDNMAVGEVGLGVEKAAVESWTLMGARP